jgi:hypothetical protein
VDEDFDSALTELTLTAGRDGRLPAVNAVRARGDQRRRRQQTQLTALSVVLLTGIATSLLSSNVIGSAEQAPVAPAHSGPTASLPVTSSSTSHPTTATPVPAARPTGAADDPSVRSKMADEQRLKAAVSRDYAKKSSASSSAAAARQRRIKLGLTGTTTTAPTALPTLSR